MSEFQYYEFVAIDRPLSLSAQTKLRAIASRATITANRLVNTYEWGDFNGDPHALVTKHFDVFLYYANWGARHLMLRIPVAKLDANLALQHCARRQTRSRGKSGVATVSVNTTHLIFSWWSERGNAENRVELESSALGALTPLRNELMSGDYRALYLAWLQWRQAGEVLGTDRVPTRPPNMKRMTGSQMALAELLRIDLLDLHRL